MHGLFLRIYESLADRDYILSLLSVWIVKVKVKMIVMKVDLFSGIPAIHLVPCETSSVPCPVTAEHLVVGQLYAGPTNVRGYPWTPDFRQMQKTLFLRGRS
jgi:hypothetical protein